MSMQDTMKLMSPLDFKSVPVMCESCGSLVKIKKALMDTKKTLHDYGICFGCFKKKLKEFCHYN